MRPTFIACATLTLAAATSPAFAAWPNSPFTNLPVCTATGTQAPSVVESDGAGGAYVVWTDQRAGNGDIYGQHLLSTGAVDPGWTVQGVAICVAAGSQSGPVAVSDGAGGLIVAWQDGRSETAGDVYAHHLLPSGVMDPAWPVSGLAVCTVAGAAQQAPAIASDGQGGAIVVWHDNRSGTYDAYAQRVLVAGAVDPAWPVNGRALCTATGHQQHLSAVPDGSGGAVVAWEDSRSGAGNDIYAHRILSSGVVDPAWPVDGRALCTATAGQQNVVLVSDGAGGGIAAWDDVRSGSQDIYAQHVLRAGTVDGDWQTNGVALCTAAATQQFPVIAPDAEGGAIVAWRDGRSGSDDVYAQHVTARGDVDAAWPVDGRALCTATGAQTNLAIHADGAGGAVVAWTDDRVGTEDVYAQHVLASGAVDAAWPADGRAVSTASHFQQTPAIADDGNGGTIVVWQDFRNGGYDVYGQRIGRHGHLGTPEPWITSVEDVPNDEGGAVKVSWNASYLDQQSNPELDFYDLLRSVPTATAGLLRARGARVRAIADPDLRAGDLVVQTVAGTTYYWELLVSLAARHYLGGYSYVASTTGDSVPGSNPGTAFLVVGRNSATSMWWPSPPIAGYSVDNLAPAAPGPLTGQFTSGTMHLHWQPNAEADLAGYRLYRGTSAGFEPGPGTLVAALSDTGYSDPAGGAYFYKLTAVDTHGNESPVATLSPVGMVGVDGPLAAGTLWLAAPSPNPVRAATTLRYALPREGHVRLAVYDAGGRMVRELARGARGAGAHAEVWDLRDARGRTAGAGLYFARLEAAGRGVTRRIVVTR